MSSKKKQPEKPKRPTGNSVQKKKVNESFPSVYLWTGAVLLLTFIAYLPSLSCGFTAWDDHLYVTDSELIKSLSIENIRRIFSPETIVSLNYHPLTILSLAVDYHFSKLNPFQYHFVNIIFHLLNTWLAFRLAYELSGKKIHSAIFVALFFGIHPMHVESVTWIAERKDVLYTFFFLLATMTYLRYYEKNRMSLMILTFFLFMLSVLSKAMAVVFPLVMLLIDYYKGRKLTFRSIGEKIPFLLVSLVFGIFAIRVQAEGAIASFETFTLFQRICFGFYGFATYIYRLFLPINLSAFHPYPNANMEGVFHPSFYAIAFAGLSICIFALIISFIKKKEYRNFTFGIGFYLATIITVLQFLSVGGVIIAERYSYLSYFGLLFPLGIAFDNLLRKKAEYKNLLIAFIGIVAFIFTVLTYERTMVWKDPESLWTDVIQKYPPPYWHVEIALEGRGKFYATKKNDPEKALDDYLLLESMKTKNPANYNNLGNLFGSKGQEYEKAGDTIRSMEYYRKSVDYFTTSLSLDSTEPTTYSNRALLFIYIKEYKLALSDYDKAYSLDPQNPDIQEKRAFVMYLADNKDEAIKEYNKLIASNPEKASLYFYRGIAKHNVGRVAEAIDDFRKVTQLEPQNASAYFNLSNSEKLSGDFENALQHAETANRLGFRVSENYLNELRSASKK